MSLKGFHLFFIAVAALFCAAFGLWVILVEEEKSGGGVDVIGYISLAASVGLVAYSVYFVRKSKNITV